MQHLVSSQQARLLDQRTTEWGLGAELLMEVAASRMWDQIHSRFPDSKRPLLIFAGPGHNGGDALAVGRYALCARRERVGAWPITEELKPLTQKQRDLFEKCGGQVIAQSSLDDWLKLDPIVIEGISGAGRFPKEAERVLTILKQDRLYKIALDLPCGLESGPLYRANSTLCVAPLKQELYYPKNRPSCGKIHLIDLAWPPQLRRLSQEDISVFRYNRGDLPRILRRHQPSRYDHKGSRGRVLVVAGSETMLGAGQMAVQAAALIAGVVEWYVPSELQTAAQSLVLGPIVRPRRKDLLEEKISAADSVLYGPGLEANEARELFPTAIPHDAPLVLDAGALTPDLVHHPPQSACILTPHPGELARMLSLPRAEILADPIKALSAFPKNWVVILKSQPLWIAAEGRFHVFDTPNRALGFGGSGDILAGLVAAFSARYGAETASLLAVSLHQLAAHRALQSSWLTPQKLLRSLEKTLAEVTHA